MPPAVDEGIIPPYIRGLHDWLPFFRVGFCKTWRASGVRRSGGNIFEAELDEPRSHRWIGERFPPRGECQ
jgi:hypothetical protein